MDWKVKNRAMFLATMEVEVPQEFRLFTELDGIGSAFETSHAA
jgi:tryptophan synthase beta subunit